MRTLVLTALAGFAFAAPASAGVVYSNNFDAENGGNTQTNYNGFNGLTVTNGTVDLVRSGDFGIICAGGSGSCVDLDGSTGDSGLTSSGSYAFASGDRVALSFDFSGNQRGGGQDSFSLRFTFSGNTSGTYGYTSANLGSTDFGPFSGTELSITISGINSGFPMGAFTYYFDAGNGGNVSFSFQDNGNDNVGIIIDNVSLAVGAVPEPASWAMMIAGFGLLGSAVRRRRTGLAIA